jgi:hypothetical protein
VATPNGGYQPETGLASSRRADFDLLRRIAKGGGGSASLPPGADPGEVLTIDSSGNPVWAPPSGSWNTAWGVVAIGSFSQTGSPSFLPASTGTQVTNNLPFTAISGRRYRLVFNTRATSAAPGGGSIVVAFRDGGTELAGFHRSIPSSASTWDGLLAEWTLTGDGTLHQFNVLIGTSTQIVSFYGDYNSTFYLEDIGPSAGAVPAPNPARPYAVGLRQRTLKATTETGFGATEYSAGLDLSVGANDVNRWLQVQFSIRVIPVAQPPNANSIFIVRQRLGSLTGTYVTAVQFPFPLNASIYGYNLIGTFTPAGYNPGPLVTTIQTDGTGTFKLAAGDTWAALYDMGPTS